MTINTDFFWVVDPTGEFSRQEQLEFILSAIYNPNLLVDRAIRKSKVHDGPLPQSVKDLEKLVTSAKKKLQEDWPPITKINGKEYGWMDISILDVLEARALYTLAPRYGEFTENPKNEAQLVKYLNLMKYCYEVINIISNIPQVVQISDLAPAHMELAQVYNLLEDYDNALKEAEQAVETAPRDPFSHMVLAEVQAERGEKEAALDQLRIVQGLDKGLTPKIMEVATKYHLLS